MSGRHSTDATHSLTQQYQRILVEYTRHPRMKKGMPQVRQANKLSTVALLPGQARLILRYFHYCPLPAPSPPLTWKQITAQEGKDRRLPMSSACQGSTLAHRTGFPVGPEPANIHG